MPSIPPSRSDSVAPKPLTIALTGDLVRHLVGVHLDVMTENFGHVASFNAP